MGCTDLQQVQIYWNRHFEFWPMRRDLLYGPNNDTDLTLFYIT